MSSEKIRVIILFAFFAALVAFAVTYSPTSALSRPADQRSSVLPIGKPLQIKVPLGLPPLPAPADNPPTAETVALGRRLYYDPSAVGGQYDLMCIVSFASGRVHRS